MKKNRIYNSEIRMTVTLVGSTFLAANRDDPALYHGHTYLSIQYGFGHTTKMSAY